MSSYIDSGDNEIRHGDEVVSRAQMEKEFERIDSGSKKCNIFLKKLRSLVKNGLDDNCFWKTYLNEERIPFNATSNYDKIVTTIDDYKITIERLFPFLRFYLPLFEITEAEELFYKKIPSAYSKFVEYYAVNKKALKNFNFDFNNFGCIHEERLNPKEFQKVATKIGETYWGNRAKDFVKENRKIPLVWILYPDNKIEVKKIEKVSINGRIEYFFTDDLTPYEPIWKKRSSYKIEKDKVIKRVPKDRIIRNTDGYEYY